MDTSSPGMTRSGRENVIAFWSDLTGDHALYGWTRSTEVLFRNGCSGGQNACTTNPALFKVLANRATGSQGDAAVIKTIGDISWNGTTTSDRRPVLKLFSVGGKAIQAHRCYQVQALYCSIYPALLVRCGSAESERCCKKLEVC